MMMVQATNLVELNVHPINLFLKYQKSVSLSVQTAIIII